MPEKPSYEDVLKGRLRGFRGGYYATVLHRMKPGEVAEVTGVRAGTSLDAVRNGVMAASKRYEIPVATSIADGVLWVARLKPEDIEERNNDGHTDVGEGRFPRAVAE